MYIYICNCMSVFRGVGNTLGTGWTKKKYTFERHVNANSQRVGDREGNSTVDAVKKICQILFMPLQFQQVMAK